MKRSCPRRFRRQNASSGSLSRGGSSPRRFRRQNASSGSLSRGGSSLRYGGRAIDATRSRRHDGGGSLSASGYGGSGSASGYGGRGVDDIRSDDGDAEIMSSRSPAGGRRGAAEGSPVHSQPPAVGAAACFAPAGSSPPRNLTAAVSVPAPELSDSDDDSGSEMSTDEDDDRFHGYRRPVPRGDALRVSYSPGYQAFLCPVCPNKKAARWRKLEDIKNHVVGVGTSARWREDYKKKWSRHRVLARNEGWM